MRLERLEDEPVHDTGAELFHQHVGPGDQVTERGETLGGLEVEFEEALGPVEERKGDRTISDERRIAAHVLAAGAFHLQDIGTGFGEHQGCQRAGKKRGEIDGFDALERAVHGGFLLYVRTGRAGSLVLERTVVL